MHYPEVEHRDGTKETKWASMQKTINSFARSAADSGSDGFIRHQWQRDVERDERRFHDSHQQFHV